MKMLIAGFDDDRGGKGTARAVRQVIGADEVLADLIDGDAPVSGGPLARAQLVLEDYHAWRLHVYRPDPATRGKMWRIGQRQVENGSWRSLLATESQGLPELTPYAHSRASGGALTRREHASVEFTSATGSRVIIDPIFRSRLLRCAVTMPPPAHGINAAFVTHNHSDHFDLATLDWLAARGATVYVPPVPRRSLLAEDMFRQLDACGLPGRICEAGSLTQAGDITVEALPFLGEQPSPAVSPVEPGIRNWGNCYRIDSPGYSVLVLADSGVDPTGSMVAEISDMVKRRGPVDIVLGCLRYLYLPFDAAGLTSYYATLPVSGLRADYELYKRGRLPSATLGISGTAIACAEAKAKVFLPYAHGLTGYAQPISENAFGPGHGFNESMACAALSRELKRIGSDTTVLGWNPGDSWVPAAARTRAQSRSQL
jgi:L-ascorbate metabolism protein UlaG (beta-lactamase superfamily)